MKGEPNLKTARFCERVNEDLLFNSSPEPGLPKKVSMKQPGNSFTYYDRDRISTS